MAQEVDYTMAKPAYYSLCQTGSSGPDVALIQTWLNGIRSTCTRYPVLTVDGKFGSGTERAVRQFQMQSNLTSDGKVGKNTWDALYNRYILNHSAAQQYPGIPMRSGDRGATVKSAQRQLNVKGANITADGRFGSRTAGAVRSFQKANDLPADGVIGPETWAALYR